MSNTKNLANLATALDDGTSGQVLQSTGSGGVAFADAGGSGVTTHTNQDAMVSADALQPTPKGLSTTISIQTSCLLKWQILLAQGFIRLLPSQMPRRQSVALPLAHHLR